MLGKVLAAFRARLAILVDKTIIKSLLADMTVSNKMGAAPSALLAGAAFALMEVGGICIEFTFLSAFGQSGQFLLA